MKKVVTLALILCAVAAAPNANAKPKSLDPPWLVKVKNDCIQRVSGQYGVTADKVSLGKHRDDAKGLFNIQGKVNKGPEGIKSFMCKFNVDGALVDVMSMTSDGAL